MRFPIPLAALAAATAIAVALASAGCVTVNVPSKAQTPAPAEKTDPVQTDAGDLTAGDNVAAVWSDGNRYLATIQAIDGDQITVKYADDSSVKTVNSADVQTIVPQTWSVGDKVLAVWSAGRFYKGTVVGASGGSYKIQWDDGSAPTEVTADKIIAQ